MTLGRRFELLTANASRNIPRARRDELLDSLEEWLVEMELSNPEERFWILAAGAAMWMGEYCKIVQAREGAEILQREMGQ
jgi:hypothetical protein